MKGERTVCADCGGLLAAVLPVENVRHWRHRAGDCDPWSQPEGPWHLGWKERFDLTNREVAFTDPATGERHRADVLCGAGTPSATVLELQHSSIAEGERIARESFYRQAHRMFWLVHIHNEQDFTGYSFGFSLDWKSRPRVVDGREYAIMRWHGRSVQLIEKWKRATGYVFFDWDGYIFFLPGEALSARINGGPPLKRGEFALSPLDRDQFVRAVQGIE